MNSISYHFIGGGRNLVAAAADSQCAWFLQKGHVHIFNTLAISIDIS